MIAATAVGDGQAFGCAVVADQAEHPVSGYAVGHGQLGLLAGFERYCGCGEGGTDGRIVAEGQQGDVDALPSKMPGQMQACLNERVGAGRQVADVECLNHRHHVVAVADENDVAGCGVVAA